ncbi:hypothetical protein [Faecalibaculum rodentium]|uniref:hypothetical protein n=1 Tax=Faecalibaculum rodentium TaxID=1702221 RepID=UPI001F5AFDD6|nr:hypothetical protein [Faecalibaculum rodentium]
MEITRQYDVHLDMKKRVTLRNATYQHYNVKEYKNGCIILKSRKLTKPREISARTLKKMDQAVRNFKSGKVSETVDLSDF